MKSVVASRPEIFCDQEMAEPELRAFLAGRVGVYSARSPAKSTANEDAAAVVAVSDTAGVLLVADGMGGHASGEIAARCAVKEMVGAIGEARDPDTLLRSAIINGFERANRAVKELGAGAGTTLAAVEIDHRTARPYHAGDSVILIVGQRGKVKLETTSHSPVGFGVEAGLLDADEAMNHEERHVVLNAIGSDSMRIEIGSAVKLAPRDTVLLASDGLTDNLGTDEIVARIRKGPLGDSLGQLVADCRLRMQRPGGQPSKPDDLSVVAFRGS